VQDSEYEDEHEHERRMVETSRYMRYEVEEPTSGDIEVRSTTRDARDDPD
jgi:hypothetical protein